MNKVEKEIVDLKRHVKELRKNYGNLLNLIGKGKPNSQKLLVVAMDEYLAYLRNEGVYPHQVKTREPHYIAGMVNALELLKKVIRYKYQNLMNFRVCDIDEELAGWFFVELEKREYKAPTFNVYRTNINSFDIWLFGKDYTRKRVFIKILRKQLIYNPKSITKTEFENLLKIIKPTTGSWVNNLDNKVHYVQKYRPWFKAALKIILELGIRRNELIAFKFSNIIEEHGKPAYIRIEDTKVNNQRRITDDNYKKFKALPISKNLLKTLIECGYKKNKVKDMFVIAPKITDMIEREHHIGIPLSAAFKYYYRKLNTGRKLTMNSLRVADATAKHWATRGRPEWLTGHSSAYVTQTHYVDKVEIAKTATKNGYKVFNY